MAVRHRPVGERRICRIADAPYRSIVCDRAAEIRPRGKRHESVAVVDVPPPAWLP